MNGSFGISDVKSIAVNFANTVDSLTKGMPKEIEFITLTAIGSAIGVKFPRIVLIFGSLYLVGKIFGGDNNNYYVIHNKSGKEV